jgi:hypothetical protein
MNIPRKITIDFSQHDRSSGRDLNPGFENSKQNYNQLDHCLVEIQAEIYYAYTIYTVKYTRICSNIYVLYIIPFPLLDLLSICFY